MTPFYYFVFFDTINNKIDLTKSYKVENIFMRDLEMILGVNQEQFLCLMNNNKSPNADKKFETVALTEESFKPCITVLEIENLYNPEVSQFKIPVRVMGQ